MDPAVKEEVIDAELPLRPVLGLDPLAVIDLSSSSSDSDDEDGCVGMEVNPRVPAGGAEDGGSLKKRRCGDGARVLLPLGFLEPLSPEEPRPLPPRPQISGSRFPLGGVNGCRQFWKAGDYEGGVVVESSSHSAGMDHVRVHPKFLHSNATSHKWALGAVAELLDNALDEVCNGATFVKIDMLENKKDKAMMLLVEDNGGGMDPDIMRQCMSLGYSAKSKLANTIGQYGNGFKTSTMRLGADVIVFSHSCGKGGRSSTQSVGMLSYTFLRNTGKEDIIVPMLDYEKEGETWKKLVRSSSVDWNRNLETILQWSPYSSEADLLQQFSSITDHGTCIIIYNLWEDDQGELELDFNADKYDIQVRGVNRDEGKIEMATQFPNSRHFLTYRHSLRSYASILYLRLRQGFKMILRGKEIDHHNIVNDMMLKQEVTYKPQSFGDGAPRDQNMVATVTIGFVKDAKNHIDVQGFNVYHKNRLIKPFWRVWNASGSEGRGVIGILEANFVEPAHDKQGFERTTVLSRLEARLIQMQRNYWRTEAHKIGYAQRIKEKLLDNIKDKEILPEASINSVTTPVSNSQGPIHVRSIAGKGSISPVESNRISQGPIHVRSIAGKGSISPVESNRMENGKLTNVHNSFAWENRLKSVQKAADKSNSSRLRVHEQLRRSSESDSDSDYASNRRNANRSSVAESPSSNDGVTGRSCSKETMVDCNRNEPNSQKPAIPSLEQLKCENHELKDRLKQVEDENISLTEKIEEAEKRLEQVNREQEALIDIFSEERCRRDREEENLRKKVKGASIMIEDLLEKLSSNRNSKGEC